MSDDLISRQAAIDIFNDYNIAVENGEIESYRRYREQLSWLPSVQSKAGHWRDTITAGINETVCSVCLYSGFHHFNYCPNCGAKMKGEKE